MKKVLQVLGVIFIVGFVLNLVLSFTSNKNTATVTNNGPSVTQQTPAQPEPEQSKALAVKVGDTVQTQSLNITWESVGVIQSDNPYMQADEGKEFVEVVLLLENTGASDIAVSSLMNFDLYVDGYAADGSDLSAMAASSYDSLNGKIAPGKMMEGCLAMQVAPGWSEIELVMDYIPGGPVQMVYTR